MIPRFAVLLLVLPLLGSGIANAEPASGGDLSVNQAWARASVVSNGVAYLTIRNTGSETDRLVGASSDVAERVEIHTSEMTDGVMRMKKVDALEIPAGGSVTLEPGGRHVMLMGLDGRLVEGSSFSLTLRFEHAGDLAVDIPVRSVGAQGPGPANSASGNGGHNHGGHEHH